MVEPYGHGSQKLGFKNFNSKWTIFDCKKADCKCLPDNHNRNIIHEKIAVTHNETKNKIVTPENPTPTLVILFGMCSSY